MIHKRPDANVLFEACETDLLRLWQMCDMGVDINAHPLCKREHNIGSNIMQAQIHLRIAARHLEKYNNDTEPDDPT